MRANETILVSGGAFVILPQTLDGVRLAHAISRGGVDTAAVRDPNAVSARRPTDDYARQARRRGANVARPRRVRGFATPAVFSGADQPRSASAGQGRRELLGFSLIEVIAAVGIFAIGMVAVLGMFAPVTKSVATVADSEAAARAADAVRARLQALPFDRALALVQEAADVRRNDGNPNYNANEAGRNPKVLFGKVSGDVGLYDAAEGKKAWYDASVPTPQRVDDADKFFEIDLIRNDALSPRTNDATAAIVAYNVRVRWPAFMRASSGAAVQVGANPTGSGQVPYDQSRKQVLFFTGSIQR